MEHFQTINLVFEVASGSGQSSVDLWPKKKETALVPHHIPNMFSFEFDLISVQHITHASQYGCQTNGLSIVRSGFFGVGRAARPR